MGPVQLALILMGMMAMVVATPGLAAAIQMAADWHEAQQVQAPDLLGGPLGLSGVAPFILRTADPLDRTRAIQCMAEAIYYEAGFEPVDGQRAVAQVVVNRVRDSNFPDSVCGVVYQGWQRKTGCQFSFVCDGSLKRRPPTDQQMAWSSIIAEQALNGYVATEVGTATHYHTDYVSPYWEPTLVEITKIGAHIFYRWPGQAGQPAALRDAYAGGEEHVWRTAAAALHGLSA